MVFSREGGRTGSGPEQRVERGPILDRNGRILAIQTRLYNVSAWKPNVEDPADCARILSEILDMDAAKLEEKLKEPPQFTYIKRKITPTESEVIKELIDEGQLSGIQLEEDFGRNYPEKELASHVIGYTGTDNEGLDGIEYTLDDFLSPRPEDHGDNGNDQIYGNQVFLTIDINIQYRINEIAEHTLVENNAESVMILVMDAESGEILSYSSIPAFDPNRFDEFDRIARYNRPVSFIYEPGSVFKIFSIASLLDLGGIDPGDYFDTDGAYYQEFENGETFTITDLADYGRINPREIIKYSSNVGAAYASERVGEDAFYEKLTDFGFGETTGIALNGEEAGLLSPPGTWSARSKPTIAMGQEIGVTAVQMLAGATVFANDGVLLRPQIVKKIVSPAGKTLFTFQREPIRRVIDPDTAQTMLSYMNTAVSENGTARLARAEGFSISAKTGTAQVWSSESGDYSEDRFIPSCLGIFPTEDPKLIVYVVIENPRGDSYYGGRIAAPVIRECAEFLVPYRGIPRDGDHEIALPRQIAVNVAELPEFDRIIPDFTGLPKKTLLPLFKRDDIRLRISGEGWVVRQSPPPGTELEDGMELHLELE
jgi:cell division protein FtsI (penicillin-binding protein 3)